MAVTFKINSGEEFLVDEEDLIRVSEHSWYSEKSRSKIYMRSRIDGKLIRLHSFIIGNQPKNTVVDHINGNTMDNRKENLRVSSKGQNIQRGFEPKNQYLGVSYFPSRSLYRARISNKHLGYFKTPEEAAIAYNEAVIEIYGNLAKINHI